MFFDRAKDPEYAFRWVIPVPDDNWPPAYVNVVPPPEWILGYVAWFPTEVGLKVLLWIFVIIPVTIVTLYVYEPSWCRKYRALYWAKFWRKGKLDREQFNAGEMNSPVPQTIGNESEPKAHESDVVASGDQKHPLKKNSDEIFG